MRQVGSEVAGAAGTAERWESRLLGVQRGWKRGGEVDVGQVRQGTPGVVGGRNQGCSVFLVSRWKDAGKRPDIGELTSWTMVAGSPLEVVVAVVRMGGWGLQKNTLTGGKGHPVIRCCHAQETTISLNLQWEAAYSCRAGRGDGMRVLLLSGDSVSKGWKHPPGQALLGGHQQLSIPLAWTCSLL